MRLAIERIEAARSKIDPIFLDTPGYACEALGRALGCRIVLKIETMNPIRCFKGRGVETALADLDAAEGPRAVVCASAGNLGQALAYCGRARGYGVTVTASVKANPAKLERMRGLGADVVLVEGAIEEALAAAAEIARQTGAALIEDSMNVATCEGAGTIGLELASLPRPLDAVLIALGAGAMATGVGHAMRCRSPATEVLTVQPEQAAGMTLSWRAGHPVDAGAPRTIADGVAGRYVIPQVLDDLRSVVGDALLVSEESILDGMRLLYRCSGLIVEPAAALGLAAILENRERFRGTSVATIVCGGTISADDFERWVVRA